jgi:DNA-directed RNA polymerase subunit RPC12/RpoP
MADFVTLTCPSCGSKLEITNDVERFACGHCGNEHIVKRSGGIVSLAPVVQELGKVQLGVDKTASELAIRRLREEIAEIDNALEAIKSRHVKTIRNGIVGVLFGGGMLFYLLISGHLFADWPWTVISSLVVIVCLSMIVDGLKYSDREKKLEKVIRQKRSEVKTTPGSCQPLNLGCDHIVLSRPNTTLQPPALAERANAACPGWQRRLFARVFALNPRTADSGRYRP